jgi:hypothetical protein
MCAASPVPEHQPRLPIFRVRHEEAASTVKAVLYLIGGPPRVGKSTLAQLILERRKISGCGTDILVNMLAEAAPELGVHHGSHPDKAQSAHRFLVEFLRPFSYTGGDYLLEGDVVTPDVAGEAAKIGPVHAVFLGNTTLTIEELRIAPHWLADCDEAEYERTRDWARERSAEVRRTCEAAGYPYVETGGDRSGGLERAYRILASP